MITVFLAPEMVPFTLALALLVGLLLLEMVALLVGGSLLGMGGDAEVALGEFDADFDVAEIGDLAEVDGASTPQADAAPDAAPAGALTQFFGFGKAPFLIWLAVVLALFGLSGLTLQLIAQSAAGAMAPPSLVGVPSAALAFWGAGRFATGFARLLPRNETQSVSERALGRRKGVVTQGTARRGKPAEVRVTDAYGNIHYLRAEPLHDADEIPQGREVLVLRHRHTGSYRITALADTP